jgi:hypothetical protein
VHTHTYIFWRVHTYIFWRVQVLDVSRSPPKQLAMGRFEDPRTGTSLGEIRSLRCNCDGTRVSLLASKRVSERTR